MPGRAIDSAEGVPGNDPGVFAPGDPRADPEALPAPAVPPLRPGAPNAANALLVQLELAAGNAMCVGALAERGRTPVVVLDLERVGIGAARIGEWMDGWFAMASEIGTHVGVCKGDRTGGEKDAAERSCSIRRCVII